MLVSLNTFLMYVMEITIRKLAKVTLGENYNLPDSPGIYFVCDAAYRVWYIGISISSLRKRHQNHERIYDFEEHDAQWIYYRQWDNIGDLHEWEAENIQKFQPPLNKNLKEPELPLINLGYDQNQYFQRYQEIKQMQAALEEELEELKPNLVSLIEQHDGKIKTNQFAAYLVTKKIYNYSPEVQLLMSQLKDKKKEEEKNGTAEIKSVTIYPVLRFN